MENKRITKVAANFTVKPDIRQLKANSYGFSQISSLYSRLSNISESDIVIDFSLLSWMDAHLAPSFMTVISILRSRKNTVSFLNLQPGVRSVLQKNQFLATHIADTYNTTIPVRAFHIDDSKEFSVYAKKNLRRPEMPSMTDALRGKFFEGIDELFANCALHSKTSTGVCAGGQFYPRLNTLSFTISDGGRGIYGALCAAGLNVDTATKAIDWAMQPGNTTRSGDIPGGLGSKVIREFVTLNEGHLTIVSNDGYWCQTGGRVRTASLEVAFPGTVVVLEINTSDKNRYDFINAPDPRNIW